jgi:hypothetical protein
MQTYYFYHGVLGNDGSAHSATYPYMMREADTPQEACQKVIDTFHAEGKWLGAVIGPTNRVVILNPGADNIMCLTIGKAPK